MCLIVQMSMSMPFDVFAVVAEYLIGEYAFGTTANLNVTSWGVHQATSSILYETVICSAKTCEEWNIDPPASLKYTK
jgi:hypothetical protein